MLYWFDYLLVGWASIAASGLSVGAHIVVLGWLERRGFQTTPTIMSVVMTSSIATAFFAAGYVAVELARLFRES